MARSRWFGLLAAVGLVVAVTGCSAAPPAPTAPTVPAAPSAPVAEARLQAQQALARWTATVAAGVGGSSFVLVGEPTLMVGDDWGPNIDGGNSKMAWYAGLFDAANPLPSEAQPGGAVKWQDGTIHTVPVISAEQAFSDLKATAVQPCPDCTPLQITGARLTTATFQTSRGPAQVPTWEFSLKDTDVRLDQVAVESEITAPPVPTPNDQASGQQAAQPWVGPAVQSATVDASGMTLTVGFVGAPDSGDKPCGADYTAVAVESETAVVVIVYKHDNPQVTVCSLVGAFRTAQAALAKPLGDRTLIDMQSQPISVTGAR